VDEYLFRIGDAAEAAIVSVAGEVQWRCDRQEPAVIRAGEPSSFHRIAHQSPRKWRRCLREDAFTWQWTQPASTSCSTWDQSGRFESAS